MPVMKWEVTVTVKYFQVKGNYDTRASTLVKELESKNIFFSSHHPFFLANSTVPRPPEKLDGE